MKYLPQYYGSTKFVKIKSRKVAILSICIQLLVFGYIMGYVIIYKKGYQKFEDGVSTLTTKVKGPVRTDFSRSILKSSLFHGKTVFDAVDYVVPSQQNDHAFVMTNLIVTPRQTQGECPEHGVTCTSDEDCSPTFATPIEQGIRTGRCVSSDRNQSISVCEIYGWCPTEVILDEFRHNSSVPPFLVGTRSSTLLVKNHINFLKFDVVKNNIQKTGNKKDLKYCLYDKKTAPLCPKFKLEDIVRSCGDDYSEVAERREHLFVQEGERNKKEQIYIYHMLDNAALKGAVYGILINWDCNLDKGIDSCHPTYDFKRLDDPNSPLSLGHNFRYSNYYVENGTRYRVLTKAYGIKIDIIVTGKAGKFDVVPLLLNIGAGLGLLAVATFVCDFIVLNVLKRRRTYREEKYQLVSDGVELIELEIDEKPSYLRFCIDSSVINQSQDVTNGIGE